MSRSVFCLLAMSLASSSIAAADENPLRKRAVSTLDKAVAFYHREVSAHGGYVYHYSPDLTRRWGEGEATADQIWVQPPGTPTVGMAFLKAYDATGELNYLNAARDAAEALVYGQVESGGWTNCIDFNPRGDRAVRYRNGNGKPKGRNTSSLDDGQTQSAIRLLIHTDRALKFQHAAIHEAAKVALDALLAAQYPNGAFPQIWDGDAIPDPPAKKANYPGYDWRTEGRIKNYWDMYTLNDNVCGFVTTTLIDAFLIYNDDKYLNSLKQLGNFLIDAQMPEPQPGWAQQYNYDMQPIWARAFEPPGVSGDESQEVIETLVQIYRVTRDRKYLAPIPAAISWLNRSRLSDGRLARYYELKTNQPLYMARDGKKYFLTHDDSRLPGHYGWKWESRTDDLGALYSAAINGDPPAITPVPTEAAIQSIIASLDASGRWISIADGSQLIGDLTPAAGTAYLSSDVFSRNITVLSEWLIAGE